MRRMFLIMLALAFLLVSALPIYGNSDEANWSWYSVDSAGNVRLNLYLFWSNTCPHCAQSHHFLEGLKQRRPWLDVYAYETHDPGNLDLYRRMAQSINRVAGQVPAFIYCGNLEIGFENAETSGARLERALVRCYEAVKRQVEQQRKSASEPAASELAMLLTGITDPPMNLDGLKLPPDALEDPNLVQVPIWGETRADALSLPALTFVLAACDSVNPCAFFVLLFLLSLLIHAHSRWRMLVIGGTFVFFSAFVYFLFMAAWLNLFLVVGHLRIITFFAGLLAVVAALINVKDFFWFRKGISLTIPEEVKPGLFHRMTQLVGATRFATMLAGTIVLAALVNLYELLCTSGFPMVYTRVLTLRELPAIEYYGWLVVYNAIYVAPLALIVVGFTYTLGTRKLTEYEGRVLKLLSGLMMLLLGGALLIRPEVINSVGGAIGMLAIAIAGTAAIAYLSRQRNARAALLRSDLSHAK
jgi:hypothetical protein